MTKILIVDDTPLFNVGEIMAILKAPPTLEDIAVKHGVTIAALEAELEIGVKVESEHTNDPKIARVIATQQLAEDATYYTKRRFENSKGRPRAFRASHLEPGLVKYDEIGDVDLKTGRKKDMVLLLRKEAIDRMRPTARGIPVINWMHKNVAPEDFKDIKDRSKDKNLKPDGIVTGGSWGDDGWDWMDFLAWDKDTIDNCDRGFQVSCAYHPTEIDKTPGIYHNIPYDGEILNGEYQHLAVLNNPRYEKSMIICNSLGGTMKKFFLKLLGKTEPIEMAGAEVEMDGKKVPLELLVNSYKAVKAEEEKVALENSVKNLSDDAIVTVDGKEVTVKDLKAAHAAALLKNAAPAPEAPAPEAPPAVPVQTEEAPKAPEAVAEVKDETKPTEAEVLANAKAIKDKADEEARIAAEKAEKDKNFQALKNAKDKGGVLVKLPAYESQADRLARGKKMFGEETTAPKL